MFFYFFSPKPKEAQIIQSILDDVDERIEDISESKKLRTEDGNIQTFTLEDEDAKIKKVINLDFYDLVRLL